jgi:PDZ domain-containing protein
VGSTTEAFTGSRSVHDDTTEAGHRAAHHGSEQKVRVGGENLDHIADGATSRPPVPVPNHADTEFRSGTVRTMVHDPINPPSSTDLTIQVDGEPAPDTGEAPSDTKAPMVKRITRFAAFTIAAISLGSLTVFVLQPSGYARESTGPVIEVVVSTDASDASAPQPDPDQGRYSFTTISVRELTVAEVLAAKLRGDEVVMLTGGQGGTPYDAGTQMLLSKQRAIAAAWTLRTGTPSGTSAMVTAVTEGSPASGAGIRVGDVIEAVTGTDGTRQSVSGVADLSSSVAGSSVTFHVRRHEPLGERAFDITMQPSNGRVGVQVTTVPSQPMSGIEISTSEVGGASAGLMFTLAVLDVLTIGDVSGGRRIAGTGTIDPTGAVGPVNGVALKAAAASAAGTDVFFVPRANIDQVGNHEGMVVVAVDDASDALTWLCNDGATAACRNTN